MSVLDMIKKEQEKMKGKTLKEKLGYFWDYYKLHTLAVVFVLVLVIWTVSDIATAKDAAFSATLLNAYGSDIQEDFQKDFAAYASIDLNEYDCYIDAFSTYSDNPADQMNMAVSQRIIATTQTGLMDVLVADSETFSSFAMSLIFADLREELTPEEYEKFEPYFYYIDLAAVEAANDEVNFEEDGSLADMPSSDPSDPSTMERPMPIGIYLEDLTKLNEWNCYTYTTEAPVFGFIFSGVNNDAAHLFLQYLTE